MRGEGPAWEPSVYQDLLSVLTTPHAGGLAYTLRLMRTHGPLSQPPGMPEAPPVAGSGRLHRHVVRWTGAVSTGNGQGFNKR